MPLPTGDVIGILGDNLRLRRSVLPLSTITTSRAHDSGRSVRSMLGTSLYVRMTGVMSFSIAAAGRLRPAHKALPSAPQRRPR